MPNPIRWNSKLALAKIETPYGVDPTPAAANALLLTEITLQPMEGEDISRNLELPYFGAQETIAAGLRATFSATFELVGSGQTGVAPAWSPLMRSLAIAEIVTPDSVPGTHDGMVEYVPVTDNPESMALWFYIGPTRYVILGMAGTGKIVFNAQGIPVVQGTWTGLFKLPTDQAKPVGIDLSNFVEPQIVSKATTPVFTIGGTTLKARSFELDFANDVQPRMLINDERILIVGRDEKISLTVEAVPMATYNPYLAAQTPKPKAEIVVEHGTVVGRKVKIEAGQAAQNRPGAPTNQNGIVEWPLVFVPLPLAGNDQWKITLR